MPSSVYLRAGGAVTLANHPGERRHGLLADLGRGDDLRYGIAVDRALDRLDRALLAHIAEPLERADADLLIGVGERADQALDRLQPAHGPEGLDGAEALAGVHRAQSLEEHVTADEMLEGVADRRGDVGVALTEQVHQGVDGGASHPGQ